MQQSFLVDLLPTLSFGKVLEGVLVHEGLHDVVVFAVGVARVRGGRGGREGALLEGSLLEGGGILFKEPD